MKYRPTILNVSTACYLIGVLIYTLWNYTILSAEEGWGIVAMAGLAGIGVIAGLADLILQKAIKNRTIVNITGLILVAGLAIAILTSL